MSLGKILHSKLPDNRVDVMTSRGVHTVQFENHRAIAPDDVAIALVRMSDFYAIVRDVWREPLRRVLLVRGGGLGDILLTTPLIRALCHRGVTVDYLTTPAMACLLENNPYLNQVLTARLASHQHSFDEVTDFDLEAARDHYDAVVDLRWFAERAESLGSKRHRVDLFFDAMEMEFEPHLHDRSLDYILTAQERSFRDLVSLQIGSSAIAYAWSSTTQNRNWGWEDHRRAITALCDAGLTVVLLSEKEQISPDHRAINLTGRMGIRDTAVVIDACRAMISPDTGLFHLAQALAVPTFAYFGPFSAEVRATRPLTMLSNPGACDKAPCMGYHCAYAGTDQENQCLSVSAASLVSEVMSVIS